MNYDSITVVIPITQSHVSRLINIIPFIKQYINVKNIFAIGPLEIKPALKHISDIEFINEDTLVPGLNFNAVKELKNELGKSEKRSGWYFQQFLKMAFTFQCKDDYFLVWDSDTIPLNKIEFFNNNGQPYLSYRDYVKSDNCYWGSLHNLLEDKPLTNDGSSYICEHMLFNTSIMKSLINEIESNSNLKGQYFWEKILYSVPQKYINLSGFSEFETYAAYALTRYPEHYIKRKWDNLRNGTIFFGKNPTVEQLTWASNSFISVSLEDFDWQWKVCKTLSSSSYFRNNVSFISYYRNMQIPIKIKDIGVIFFRKIVKRYLLTS